MFMLTAGHLLEHRSMTMQLGNSWRAGLLCRRTGREGGGPERKSKATPVGPGMPGPSLVRNGRYALHNHVLFVGSQSGEGGKRTSAAAPQNLGIDLGAWMLAVLVVFRTGQAKVP